MADIELLKAEQDKARRLGKWIKAFDPKIQGTKDPVPRTVTENGLVKMLDTPIRLRDGVTVYGNIMRHEDFIDNKLPVIFNYSVYGKDGGTDISIFPPASGLDPSRLSGEYLFEAADPGWWCPRGYAVATVDARGSFQSEGDKGYYSRDVGLDGYDMVEWLGAQEWSNGKVASYGASGYAMVQWLTAAERPPSLAAIIPIDGMTDLFRELIWKGGIPETQFSGLYPFLYNWGHGMVEDVMDGPTNHPFFDEFWQSKIPALDKINCPAYIICSWGDHSLHTRGTINAYYAMSSKEKYLELHQYQKWEWTVTEESLQRQKAFLDKYLLGYETEVKFWPPVRYAVREKYYVGEWRSAPSFPPPETQYTKLFPTASKGLSYVASLRATSLSYDARKEELFLDLPIVRPLQFVGHAKLRLWVEAQGADNMDLFITLRKTDANGNEVFFPWLTVVDTGPIAFGWQRVSRRELDEKKSKPWQPYHKHERDLLPLKPGEIVPVDIEILPTSCRFRPGEKLHLVIAGHDYREGLYPPVGPIARHPNTVNQGTHIIHFGGQYDSHLLLPVIPPVPSSFLEQKPQVKMSLLIKRAKGWSDAKFLEEFLGKHAEMTKGFGSHVPVFRNYSQLVACPRDDFKDVEIGVNSDWDGGAFLAWSTVDMLWGANQSPQYRASVRSRVFADEAATVGIICQPLVDVIFDPILYGNREGAVMLALYLAKSAAYTDGKSSEYLDDLGERSRAIEMAGAGTGLLRYVLNKSVTPDDPKTYFAGTPFDVADWTSVVAMEQYWFPSVGAAKAFLDDAHVRDVVLSPPRSLDIGNSYGVVGKENVVFSKDIDF